LDHEQKSPTKPAKRLLRVCSPGGQSYAIDPARICEPVLVAANQWRYGKLGAAGPVKHIDPASYKPMSRSVDFHPGRPAVPSAVSRCSGVVSVCGKDRREKAVPRLI
jgi:hypothetical protein